MSFETLLYETRDGVAYITLNREAAANAINLQMGRDLMLAALRCDEDAGVRAVLIRAKGKIFCAGGDLGSFSSAGEGMPRLLKELTTYLHAAISRFARMRAPVVAAVHGSAAGAGFSLACASDLLVCAESAKFTLAYTRVGLTPDGSSTYYLPRLIGTRRALELMLTNRSLGAREALEWGIVNRVYGAGEFGKNVAEIAQGLADAPTHLQAMAKERFHMGWNQGLEECTEFEIQNVLASVSHPHFKPCLEAFLAGNKRNVEQVRLPEGLA